MTVANMRKNQQRLGKPSLSFQAIRF